jgi:hypothetical protein
MLTYAGYFCIAVYDAFTDDANTTRCVHVTVDFVTVYLFHFTAVGGGEAAAGTRGGSSCGGAARESAGSG